MLDFMLDINACYFGLVENRIAKDSWCFSLRWKVLDLITYVYLHPWARCPNLYLLLMSKYSELLWAQSVWKWLQNSSMMQCFATLERDRKRARADLEGRGVSPSQLLRNMKLSLPPQYKFFLNILSYWKNMFNRSWVHLWSNSLSLSLIPPHIVVWPFVTSAHWIHVGHVIDVPTREYSVFPS